MDIITNMNEVSRDELIGRYKDSLQTRITQLQAQLESKDKKLVDMTDKYMNEINDKKVAEALAEDAKSKLEEMFQNSLSACQERITALEKELDDFHRKDSLDEQILQDCSQEISQNSSRSEEQNEGESEDGAQCLSLSDSISLATLSDRFAKEQEKSMALEDKVTELEETLNVLSESKTMLEKEALKEHEWFKEMLEQERKLNEKLSNESDRNVEELQRRVRETNEVNSQLVKWKEEHSDLVTSYDEADQNYNQIISQKEFELQELQIELADSRSDLMLFRSEKKQLGEDFERENAEPEDLTIAVSAGKKRENLSQFTSAVISLGGGMGQSSEVSEVKFGNQKHRIDLANLIWDGMTQLRSGND